MERDLEKEYLEYIDNSKDDSEYLGPEKQGELLLKNSFLHQQGEIRYDNKTTLNLDFLKKLTKY